ncbi:TonB-dependent receptor [Flammeovirga sp. SJP92]|uniref:SusC/RagA family TonB-linked outer membrane protein n=1 Tax=Flammeovirga sp. SJP92 TaxID=1775430 RepID=UPI000787D243|nr:TonB-dependent receptor [Flammeovirga sp. SJP92]KXX67696.1 SusC/RagA family TonB-linked outer membrane protein [Flammeovirga sp. SJP92]
MENLYYSLKVVNKRTMAIGILFFLSQILFAQEKSLTGVVKDDSGMEIPGVNVFIKGTKKGSITGFDGKFKILGYEKTDVLIVSYVGMKTKEILIGEQTHIDVVLQEDAQQLDELIIVGYGTQDKKDITGAVGLATSEDFEDRPNQQIGNLIQGKVAGVEIASSSGSPSQGLSLRIRGTNSFKGSSEPLYVIDGVPTTDTRSLNPADVESISILKDAASAAIYGAQGGNGVVLITTKQGKVDGMHVSLDAYGGVSQVWKKMDVLNGDQYRELMTEMGRNTDWDQYNANTNWQDKVFQDGTTQNYQLSLLGKSNKTKYYVSGGWIDVVGAVRSSEMTRSNFKMNLDQEVNDWLTLGTRITYSDYSDISVNDNSPASNGGVLIGAINTPPVIGVYNEDGTFTSNPFQNWENPLASTDGLDRNFNSNRMLGNAFVEIKFLKDFSFKTNLGIEQSTGIYESFLDPYRTSYGRALNGESISNVGRYSYQIFDNILRYNKVVNNHNIEVMAGHVYQKYYWQDNYVTTRNFASDGITTPNAGSELITASASASEKANLSYISRLNYAYNDKYLLTANFRADGSSVFGPNKRWGYFPSVSVGWRLSEEGFLRDSDLISNLKLRAGWGIVGNDNIGSYAYLGRVGSGANYVIGGQVLPGIYPSTVENQDLQWEQSEQQNIGIDLGLFDGRLEFNVDAYIKRASHLLVDAPIPTTSGFDRAVQNLGALENRGMEFNINSTNIDKNDLKWTTNFNISFNRNKVISLQGEEVFGGYINDRDNASIAREGLPLGTLYGYVFDKVDPVTGRALYLTKDGESTDNPSADDRTIIGDANPDFIYGMTNTLTYKGFSLTIFLQGSQGNQMLNATRIEGESMNTPSNQLTTVLNRWQKPGDFTDIPAVEASGGVNNSRVSTRFIEDASYLRLKTLSLAYTLPQDLLDKVHVKGAKVYVTGENLFTITNYSGFDPEVNTFGGDNLAKGIDYGTYPQTRTLLLGVNLKF